MTLELNNGLKMEIKEFINNYREAFGETPYLPIGFWYSDIEKANTQKINRCLFKAIPNLLEGEIISLNEERIGCGGGKFYTRFTPMPERVPNFVSLQEKYKKTPEMVVEFIDNMDISLTERKFLNFARIDRLENFENLEGIFFLGNCDTISGLSSWAFFDNNSPNAVTTIFGSGCSSIITNAVNENKKEGRSCFLGMLDPSARPYIHKDHLSFTIPHSRLKEMYFTIRESSLIGTHAWEKIRQRINERRD